MAAPDDSRPAGATRSGAQREMVKLVEQRERASSRVDALEREAHAAGRALVDARAALVEAERRGESAARLREREKSLSDAEAATRRLPLRVQGAKQALADTHARVHQHVGANVRELVEPLERQGEAAAAAVVDAAQKLVDAYGRREAIQQQIGAMTSLAFRLRPSDVGPSSNAHAAASAAATLVAQGEPAPRLLHYPGGDQGVVAIVDEAVPA